MKAPHVLVTALFAFCGVLGVSSAQAACDPGPPEAATALLAEISSSFDADLAAANAAIAIAARLKADALAGRDVPPPYDRVTRFARPAAAATSPEVAELLRRAANDVLVRTQWDVAVARTHWASGLSEPAFGYASRVVGLDACGVDEANTAWLKARLKTHGWFTIPEYGKDADSAAFLIVQHADQDPAFQAETLPQLERLALEGKTKPSNTAALFDRVAVGERRPQRYGSQGECTGPGVWTPFKTEDPANLDKRRAALGLPPIADYEKGVSARACVAR